MMTIMEYVDQRRGRMEGDVVANASYDKQSSVAKSCGGKWRTILQKCRGRARSAWNSDEFLGSIAQYCRAVRRAVEPTENCM